MRFDKVERGRVRTGSYASEPGSDYGAFVVIGPQGEKLRIIASPGDESLGISWEHVSVSTSHRCPTWGEMCFVKDLFWDEEEPVMQLHPPRSTWINNHDYCLHLWRPRDAEIPLPPSIAVGVR